ncbi:MAG: radical SAM protein [Candidatus Omnitrophica bacterium]|nr:radical SAM protein [Candidatus Omnitrophota bacterium]
MESEKRESIISLVRYKESMLCKLHRAGLLSLLLSFCRAGLSLPYKKIMACLLVITFSVTNIASGYDRSDIDHLKAIRDAGSKRGIEAVNEEFGYDPTIQTPTQTDPSGAAPEEREVSPAKEESVEKTPPKKRTSLKTILFWTLQSVFWLSVTATILGSAYLAAVIGIKLFFLLKPPSIWWLLLDILIFITSYLFWADVHERLHLIGFRQIGVEAIRETFDGGHIISNTEKVHFAKLLFPYILPYLVSFVIIISSYYLIANMLIRFPIMAGIAAALITYPNLIQGLSALLPVSVDGRKIFKCLLALTLGFRDQNQITEFAKELEKYDVGISQEDEDKDGDEESTRTDPSGAAPEEKGSQGDEEDAGKEDLRKRKNVLFVSIGVIAAGFVINYISGLVMGTSLFDIYAACYLSSLSNRILIGGIVASIIGAASELASLYLSDNPSQRWKLPQRFISYTVLMYILGAITAYIFFLLDYIIPGMPTLRAILSLIFGVSVSIPINIFFQRRYALDWANWAEYEMPEEAAETKAEYSLENQSEKTLYGVEIRLPAIGVLHDLIQNFFSPEGRIMFICAAGYFISLLKNYVSNVREKPSWDPKIFLFISTGASIFSFVLGTWTMGVIAVVSTYIIYRHLSSAFPSDSFGEKIIDGILTMEDYYLPATELQKRSNLILDAMNELYIQIDQEMTRTGHQASVWNSIKHIVGHSIPNAIDAVFARIDALDIAVDAANIRYTLFIDEKTETFHFELSDMGHGIAFELMKDWKRGHFRSTRPYYPKLFIGREGMGIPTSFDRAAEGKIDIVIDSKVKNRPARRFIQEHNRKPRIDRSDRREVGTSVIMRGRITTQTDPSGAAPKPNNSAGSSGSIEVVVPDLAKIAGCRDFSNWGNPQLFMSGSQQSYKPSDEAILERLGIGEGDRIFGFAGFLGDWLAELAKRGAVVVYTDINPEVVDWVRVNREGKFAEVRVADPLDEPNQPNLYDWSFSYEPTPLEPTELILVVLRSMLNRKGFISVYSYGGTTDTADQLKTFAEIYGLSGRIDMEDGEEFKLDETAGIWKRLVGVRSRTQQTGNSFNAENPFEVTVVKTNEHLRAKAKLDLLLIDMLQPSQEAALTGLAERLSHHEIYADGTAITESLRRISRLSETLPYDIQKRVMLTTAEPPGQGAGSATTDTSGAAPEEDNLVLPEPSPKAPIDIVASEVIQTWLREQAVKELPYIAKNITRLSEIIAIKYGIDIEQEALRTLISSPAFEGRLEQKGLECMWQDDIRSVLAILPSERTEKGLIIAEATETRTVNEGGYIGWDGHARYVGKPRHGQTLAVEPFDGVNESSGFYAYNREGTLVAWQNFKTGEKYVKPEVAETREVYNGQFGWPGGKRKYQSVGRHRDNQTLIVEPFDGENKRSGYYAYDKQGALIAYHNFEIDEKWVEPETDRVRKVTKSGQFSWNNERQTIGRRFHILRELTVEPFDGENESSGYYAYDRKGELVARHNFKADEKDGKWVRQEVEPTTPSTTEDTSAQTDPSGAAPDEGNSNASDQTKLSSLSVDGLRQRMRQIKVNQREPVALVSQALKGVAQERIEGLRQQISSLNPAPEVNAEIDRILSAQLNRKGRENLAALIVFLRPKLGVDIEWLSFESAHAAPEDKPSDAVSSEAQQFVPPVMPNLTRNNKPTILYVSTYDIPDKEWNPGLHLTPGALISALRDNDFQARYFKRLGKREFLGDFYKGLNYNIRFVSLGASYSTPEAKAEALKHYIRNMRDKPDMVLMSPYSDELAAVSKISDVLESVCPKAIRIAGGVHASIDAEDTLRKTGFHIAAFGEGVETICELSARIAGTDGAVELFDIDGICHWGRNGYPVRNNIRRRLLADHPYASRSMDIIWGRRLRDFISEEKFLEVGIVTEMGCDKNCAFCGNWALRSRYGKPWLRSAESIVAEMKELYEIGIRFFGLVGENFCASRERVDTFTRLLREEVESGNFEEGFVYTIGARADDLDKELIREMRDTGLVFVEIGFESGDPEVLRRMGKKQDLENLKAVSQYANRRGVGVLWHTLVGTGEPWPSVLKTACYMDDVRPKPWGWFSTNCEMPVYVTIPYPGTRIAREGTVRLVDLPYEGFIPPRESRVNCIYGEFIGTSHTETDAMLSDEIFEARLLLHDFYFLYLHTFPHGDWRHRNSLTPRDMIENRVLSRRTLYAIFRRALRDLIVRAQEGLNYEKRKEALAEIRKIDKGRETKLDEYSQSWKQDQSPILYECTANVSFGNGFHIMKHLEIDNRIRWMKLTAVLWTLLEKRFNSIRFDNETEEIGPRFNMILQNIPLLLESALKELDNGSTPADLDKYIEITDNRVDAFGIVFDIDRKKGELVVDTEKTLQNWHDPDSSAQTDASGAAPETWKGGSRKYAARYLNFNLNYKDITCKFQQPIDWYIEPEIYIDRTRISQGIVRFYPASRRDGGTYLEIEMDRVRRNRVELTLTYVRNHSRIEQSTEMVDYIPARITLDSIELHTSGRMFLDNVIGREILGRRTGLAEAGEPRKRDVLELLRKITAGKGELTQIVEWKTISVGGFNFILGNRVSNHEIPLYAIRDSQTNNRFVAIICGLDETNAVAYEVLGPGRIKALGEHEQIFGRKKKTPSISFGRKDFAAGREFLGRLTIRKLEFLGEDYSPNRQYTCHPIDELVISLVSARDRTSHVRCLSPMKARSGGGSFVEETVPDFIYLVAPARLERYKGETPDFRTIKASEGKFVTYPLVQGWIPPEYLADVQRREYEFFQKVGELARGDEKDVVYRRIDAEDRVAKIDVSEDRNYIRIEGLNVDKKPLMLEVGRIGLSVLLYFLTNSKELGRVPDEIRTRIKVSPRLRQLIPDDINDVIRINRASLPLEFQRDRFGRWILGFCDHCVCSWPFYRSTSRPWRVKEKALERFDEIRAELFDSFSKAAKRGPRGKRVTDASGAAPAAESSNSDTSRSPSLGKWYSGFLELIRSRATGTLPGGIEGETRLEESMRNLSLLTALRGFRVPLLNEDKFEPRFGEKRKYSIDDDMAQLEGVQEEMRIMERKGQKAKENILAVLNSRILPPEEAASIKDRLVIFGYDNETTLLTYPGLFSMRYHRGFVLNDPARPVCSVDISFFANMDRSNPMHMRAAASILGYAWSRYENCEIYYMALLKKYRGSEPLWKIAGRAYRRMLWHDRWYALREIGILGRYYLRYRIWHFNLYREDLRTIEEKKNEFDKGFQGFEMEGKAREFEDHLKRRYLDAGSSFEVLLPREAELEAKGKKSGRGRVASNYDFLIALISESIFLYGYDAHTREFLRAINILLAGVRYTDVGMLPPGLLTSHIYFLLERAFYGEFIDASEKLFLRREFPIAPPKDIEIPHILKDEGQTLETILLGRRIDTFLSHTVMWHMSHMKSRKNRQRAQGILDYFDKIPEIKSLPDDLGKSPQTDASGAAPEEGDSGNTTHAAGWEKYLIANEKALSNEWRTSEGTERIAQKSGIAVTKDVVCRGMRLKEEGLRGLISGASLQAKLAETGVIDASVEPNMAIAYALYPYNRRYCPREDFFSVLIVMDIAKGGFYSLGGVSSIWRSNLEIIPHEAILNIYVFDVSQTKFIEVYSKESGNGPQDAIATDPSGAAPVDGDGRKISRRLSEKIEKIQGCMRQANFTEPLFLAGSTLIDREGADLDLFVSGRISSIKMRKPDGLLSKLEDSIFDEIEGLPKPIIIHYLTESMLDEGEFDITFKYGFLIAIYPDFYIVIDKSIGPREFIKRFIEGPTTDASGAAPEDEGYFISEFRDLEAQRKYLHPARYAFAQLRILPLISRGIAWEMGSGMGHLRKLIGDTLPDGVTWVESDERLAVLQEKREYPTDKVVAKLPAIPVKNLAIIIGANILDVLNNEQVRMTMQSAFSALEEGGLIVHLSDLAPAYTTDIKEAMEEGLVLLPYPEDYVQGSLGIRRCAYIDKEQAIRALEKRTPPLDSIENIERLVPYINDPQSLWRLIRGSGEEGQRILNGFRNLIDSFRSAGLDITIKPRAVLLEERLSAAAREAGFIIDEERTREYHFDVLMDRSALLEDLDSDVNSIFSDHGITVGVHDPFLEIEHPNEDKVLIDTTVRLFVARKDSTEEETPTSKEPEILDAGQVRELLAEELPGLSDQNAARLVRQRVLESQEPFTEQGLLDFIRENYKPTAKGDATDPSGAAPRERQIVVDIGEPQSVDEHFMNKFGLLEEVKALLFGQLTNAFGKGVFRGSTILQILDSSNNSLSFKVDFERGILEISSKQEKITESLLLLQGKPIQSQFKTGMLLSYDDVKVEVQKEQHMPILTYISRFVNENQAISLPGEINEQFLSSVLDSIETMGIIEKTGKGPAISKIASLKNRGVQLAVVEMDGNPCWRVMAISTSEEKETGDEIEWHVHRISAGNNISYVDIKGWPETNTARMVVTELEHDKAYKIGLFRPRDDKAVELACKEYDEIEAIFGTPAAETNQEIPEKYFYRRHLTLRDMSEDSSTETPKKTPTSPSKEPEEEAGSTRPTDPSGAAPLAYTSVPDVYSIGSQSLVTAEVIAKRNVPSIRLTESRMLEMLRRDANLILRLRRDPEFLKFIKGKEFRLSLDKGWKDDNPDEYRVVVEYWKTLSELFKGYADFNVVIVPTKNGQNGLMKVTCRQIGERYGGQSSSITLTGSRDIGPRLLTLLNIAFIGSNIPDIEDAERIADYNILIELLNEEYFKLTGIKPYIDIETYTKETIKGKLRIIKVNLRPIRREDYRKTLEIKAAIEALRAV